MKTVKQVYQAKKQATDTEPMPDGRKRKRKLETINHSRQATDQEDLRKGHCS